MSINYEVESAALISRLEREVYSTKTIAEHRRCFEGLRKYLTELESGYTMNIAVDWLESRKKAWSYDTYKRYRRALYRFEKHLRTGEISGDPHCHNNFFAYHDADVSYIKLSDNYKLVYHEFYGIISGERAKGTVDHYIAGCTDFLLFLSEQGCTAPNAMTVEHTLEYLCRIQDNSWSAETKKKYAEGVGQLLLHFSSLRLIPRCYAHIMRKFGDKTVIMLLKVTGADGVVFQPSKSLESQIDEFLSKLSEQRYSESPQKLHGFIFTNFCLFLEVNHIAYSRTAAELWLNHIPKTTSWELKRQIITRFADYMATGITERIINYVWKPLLIDSLPVWSRKIMDNYLELRDKEGCESSTLMMCRSSCVRFFRFLASNGIGTPGEITPSLVKEFHNTDLHTTPEGRNAYAVRVRRLLEYMAEENLVPPNLYLAISTQCAQKHKIVTVMSDEMISVVYSYRESAATAEELRDAAFVMLGLRMGLRSSDIVKLKTSDFDLKKRKLSIIQAKTNKAITLSIPIDVGNSVYKYITQGRPKSGSSGVGFIFIKHKSPYSALGRVNCKRALVNILSEQGLELPRGQGFHITRRTFATQLLRSRTPVDKLVDALGHSTRMSVSDYLLHDEDGMRLCPMPFVIGGSQ